MCGIFFFLFCLQCVKLLSSERRIKSHEFSFKFPVAMRRKEKFEKDLENIKDKDYKSRENNRKVLNSL